MRMTKKMLAAFAVAGLAPVLPALAVTFTGNLGQIEGEPTSTTVGTNSTPVIDYVASAPGTSDGYTYTNYALLANDGTGSVEIFGKFPAGGATAENGYTGPTGASYTPAAGDDIDVAGTYSPYNGIPEIGTLTSYAVSQQGDVPNAPVSLTAAQLSGTGANAYNSDAGLGHLATLDNVSFLNGSLTIPTHSNNTYHVTDGQGNVVTVYQWASSYSAAGALGGTTIPSGYTDLTGIIDVFGTGAAAVNEFIPFSITAVPEPTSMGLIGVAAFGLLKRRRAAK